MGATLTARATVLVAIAVFALALAASAFAVNFYCNYTIGSGGYASTSGWNYRDYNRVCADPQSVSWDYLGAAGFFDTNMNRTDYSGDVWTNCSLGHIARIEKYAYRKCRCWNHDVDAVKFVCQTTP